MILSVLLELEQATESEMEEEEELTSLVDKLLGSINDNDNCCVELSSNHMPLFGEPLSFK